MLGPAPSGLPFLPTGTDQGPRGMRPWLHAAWRPCLPERHCPWSSEPNKRPVTKAAAAQLEAAGPVWGQAWHGIRVPVFFLRLWWGPDAGGRESSCVCVHAHTHTCPHSAGYRPLRDLSPLPHLMSQLPWVAGQSVALTSFHR